MDERLRGTMTDHTLATIFIVVCSTIVAALLWVIITSNRLTQLRNLLRESWSDIDIQLKRRHDLIPNLVEVVRGYAVHEETVLDRVVQARQNAIVQTKSIANQIASESQLVGALNGLFARVEAYPDLKASQQYLALQQELIDTEDRIAAARRFYNANVRDFNTIVESFPSSIVASMVNFAPIPSLQFDAIEISTPISVNLGSLEPGSPAQN